MRYLEYKFMQSVLASVFVLLSFNLMAKDGNNGQTNIAQKQKEQCASNLKVSKACAQYVRGYLAALKQLNQNKISPAFSSFEERAYRTRLGLSRQTDLVKNQLGVCLPNDISDREIDSILLSGRSNQPAKDALVKVLRDKYPC